MTDTTQTSHGTAITKSASRYLQQLCKHWSHKAQTKFDPTSGSIEFDSGNQLTMTAGPDQLDLDITLPADGDLEKFKHVVDVHLKRFAFREELEIVWSV